VPLESRGGRPMKSIGVILVMLCCWGGLLSAPIPAEAGEGMCFSFPDLRGRPGAGLSMGLQASNMDAALAVEATVTYPADKLTAVSVAKTGFSGDMTLVSNLNTPGEIRIAMADANGISGNGELFEITFDATSEAGAHAAVQLQSIAVNEVAHTDCITHGSITTTTPAVSIGAPSASMTRAGPVSFTISYADVDAISLNAADVTLNKSGTADGAVQVAGEGTENRTITIASITGDGTLGISLKAGTASDSAGNAVAAAGPSATFDVHDLILTITASAGTGGSISPSGAVSVDYGADKTFQITPAANHEIADVLVDGVSVGAVSSYGFHAVAADHAIKAAFARITHTIAAGAGAHGTITPSGSVTVNQGADRTFSLKAETGYHVKDVLVDGVSKGGVATYTFTNIMCDHTIEGSFESNVAIVVDRTTIAVREGESAQFQVKLSERPLSDVVVSTAWTGGDTDVNALSGSRLTFTPVNWNSYQPVRLTAVPDEDMLGGSAEICLSAEYVAPVKVMVREVDLCQCPSLLALPDLNGNGYPEVAVLKRNPEAGTSRVYVKDSGTGTLVRTVTFTSGYAPRGLAFIDDPAVRALAMLQVNPKTDVVRVELRDAHTGKRIKNVPFDKTYSPKALKVLPDINGDGASELAVLCVSPATGGIKAQVRSSQTGSLVKDVAFAKGYAPRGFVPMPDLNKNTAPELVVLEVSEAGGNILAQVKDSRTGSLIKSVSFNKAYVPQALSPVPDVNSNGVPELAVIGRSSAGAVVAQLKDAMAGALVKTVKFSKSGSAMGISVVPDAGRPGGSRLATLRFSGLPGKMTVEERDPLTGASIRNIPFAYPVFPLAVAVLPEANGSGGPGLAVLGIHKASGRMRVEIRDAVTGVSLRRFLVP